LIIASMCEIFYKRDAVMQKGRNAVTTVREARVLTYPRLELDFDSTVQVDSTTNVLSSIHIISHQ